MSAPDPSLESVLQETGWLHALARSLVRDAGRAEDAVQDTLLTAVERRGEAQAARRGWLAKVLRNRVRQEQRARGRRQEHEARARSSGSASPEGAPDVAARLELQTIVIQAVRELEEPYRSAIVQRFFDGAAPREMARRDGCPVKTIHTRIDRGLAKLRARLDGKFGGGRDAWVVALLPFASPPSAWPWTEIGRRIGEGTAMGVKTKVATLVVLGIAAVWIGTEVIESDARGSRPEVEYAPAPTTAALVGASADPEIDVTAPGTAREPASPADAGRTPADPPVASPAASSSSAHLMVRVRKRDAGPLARGAVELRVLTAANEAPDRAFDPKLAPTDAAGIAGFDVPAARALWVTAEAQERDPLDPVQRATIELPPLRPGEQRTETIELAHGLDGVFHGLVVAAEDSRALPGARIAPTVGAPAVESDVLGSFEFPFATWAPDEIEVSCAGFGARRVQIGLTDQTRDEPFVIALERLASLEAWIDAPGFAALTLDLVRSDRGWTTSVALDSAGKAVVEELVAGVGWILEVHAEGELLWREPEPLRLLPGERRAIELHLGSGTLAYGFLRDRERGPANDQEVWAIAADEREGPVAGRRRFFDPDEDGSATIARPNVLGRFEFSHLPPGRWWIGPAAVRDDDHALAARALGVEILPGELTRRIDLESQRGQWIRGRVSGPGGRALENAHVWAQHTEGGKISAYSGGNGAFSVGPLITGTYSLGVVADGIMGGWGNDPVQVQAGATGVELRVGVENSIAGRVEDAEGHPVDARVHLLQRGGSLGQGTSYEEQGAFLFSDLSPGTWSAIAGTEDGRVALAKVELERGKSVSDLFLLLEPGAKIGVKHDLTRNVRCSIWSRGILVADSTVRAGGEGFEAVPAGPLRVELYDGSVTLAIRELVARAGRVESVEFDVE